VGKSQAQRDKEQRRAARLASAQDAERKLVRRRQRWTIALVLVLGVVLFLMVLQGFLISSDDETADPVETDPAVTNPTAPVTFAPPVNVTLPAAGETVTGETACPPVDGSAERTTTFEQAPPRCIDVDKRYRAVVHTSAGDMTFLLNDDGAPESVNNFVVLARYHYYDGLPFYSILPGLMLLTGDATGDPEVGKGGPGYTIEDEIPDVGVLYTPGSLHTWTDEADQNGSRFLIASVGEEVASLPNHTQLGTMLDGFETLQAIEALGSTGGEPTAEVVIESIEIIEEDSPSDTTGDTTGDTTPETTGDTSATDPSETTATSAGG
jgi:cyclophilin family peptidyl-prolyl cis-trans isomerase